MKNTLNKYVFVIDKNNNPISPTTSRKANKLLREGKAIPDRRSPFTIKLKYDTPRSIEPFYLGIDPGYTYVGFSIISKTNEIISGTFELRQNVSKLITDKSIYRRARRNRHTRYRKPRFLNRGGDKKGWLAPSIQHRLDQTLKLIQILRSICPIPQENIIIEKSKFDMQKMKNPDIQGKEYQQGELYGYEVRQYVLERDKYQCVYCDVKNVPFEMDHIIPKSKGGINAVNNLVCCCHKCNQKKGNLSVEEFKPGFKFKKQKPMRDATYMNLIESRIIEKYNYDSMFGYDTKYKRINLKLEKSHCNDAFVIAGGTNQKRSVSYEVSSIRRNNRSLETIYMGRSDKKKTGISRSIRKKRYTYQNGDIIEYENKKYICGGVGSLGSVVYLKDKNTGKNLKHKSGKSNMTAQAKKVKIISYNKGLQFRCLSKLME